MLNVGAAFIFWEYDWKWGRYWAQSAEVQAKPGTEKVNQRRGVWEKEGREEVEEGGKDAKEEEKRGLDILYQKRRTSVANLLIVL